MKHAQFTLVDCFTARVTMTPFSTPYPNEWCSETVPEAATAIAWVPFSVEIYQALVSAPLSPLPPGAAVHPGETPLTPLL